MGNYPIKTYLRISNETDTDFVTKVIEVDDHDFYYGTRPNVNFQGVRVSKHSSVEKEENVADWASYSAFEMILRFDDGTEDHFRIHQKVVIGCCASFQHFTKSHRISYQVYEWSQTLHIRVLNTEEQLENQRAQQINKEGETQLALKKYAVAVSKFQEARRKANNYWTVRQIDGNLGKAEKALKAQKLFEEGKNLARSRNYEKALTKLEESLKLTEDQSEIVDIKKQKSVTLKEKEENDEAKKLNREGEEAMHSRNYELAIKKFEGSLRLAHTQTLLKKIQNNVASNLDAYARHMYEEAWKLEEDETEDKSTEAEQKFEIAKKLFQRRNNENFVKLVDIKVKGNIVFNEALSLEYEATSLRNNKSFQDSRTKFRQALVKYEEALQKFQEGHKFDQKFANSVQFVQEQIREVNNNIENTKQEELSINISKVTVDTKQHVQKSQINMEVAEAEVML